VRGLPAHEAGIGQVRLKKTASAGSMQQ